MPRATVAAVIVSDRGGAPSVLLVRRNTPPFRGRWCLPGGKIDRYETARGAAVREVKEETGLDFDARFVTTHDEIIPDRQLHAVVSVYDGPYSGEPGLETTDEISALAWFRVDEAREMPLAFHHRQILDSYFDAGRLARARRHPVDGA